MSDENPASVLLNQDGPQNEEPQVKADESAAVAEKAGEEKDPQAIAKEGDDEPEEQKQKRLGGWQRKILKLEQEVEVWRDHALKNQTKAQKEETPAAAEVKEPQPPDIETFQGTFEEFKKAANEYPKQLAAFREKQSQEETAKRSFEAAVSSFNEKLAKVPELSQMQKAVAEAKVSPRLASYVGSVAAGLKNGVEVLREAVLDSDTLQSLVELDRAGDGEGIKAHLHAISAGLRFAQKQSAVIPKDETPPSTRAPKPPTPVRNAPATDTTSLEVPYKEFVERREAHIQGK